MTNGDPDSQWKAIDFFHLSVFSFGSTAFSTSLGVVVLPVLVLAVAPEEFKNTYLGILSLAGLVVAMVIQPLAGHISDRTSSPWGRRTPYIVVGSLLTCPSVFILCAASTFSVLIVGLIVTQLCINTALGPYQALIRDIAPRKSRGAASSFKVLADGSGGIVFLVLVAFLLGRYSGPESAVWLWLGLAVMS
ncbi:MFS transporter, partial [Chloroflexota bacterium]